MREKKYKILMHMRVWWALPLFFSIILHLLAVDSEFGWFFPPSLVSYLIFGSMYVRLLSKKIILEEDYIILIYGFEKIIVGYHNIVDIEKQNFYGRDTFFVITYNDGDESKKIKYSIGEFGNRQYLDLVNEIDIRKRYCRKISFDNVESKNDTMSITVTVLKIIVKILFSLLSVILILGIFSIIFTIINNMFSLKFNWWLQGVWILNIPIYLIAWPLGISKSNNEKNVEKINHSVFRNGMHGATKNIPQWIVRLSFIPFLMAIIGSLLHGVGILTDDSIFLCVILAFSYISLLILISSILEK